MGKEQSKDARVGELDWSNQQLQEIPKEHLASVNPIDYEKLNISHNQLSSLDGLQFLKCLKQINASRNNLPTYDAAIIPQLSKLNLSFNKLTTLPISLQSIQTLTELILSHNKITEISNEIECLQSLTFLDLSHNQIDKLPESFGCLVMLQTLYLNNNLLTTKGCNLGELYSLKMVDLSGNKLTNLPDVTFLASIQKLYLSNNEFSELSPTIAYLPKLKEISLRGNKLKTLPREIEENVSLTLLDLDDNQFKNPEVFATNDISLMIQYLYGTHSEKQQAISKAKQQTKQQPSLPSHVSGNAVHLSISEVGLNRKKVERKEVNVIGYTKRLFWVKGTETDILIQKIPVHHHSLNAGDCFVFDIGKKIFVWEGAESNPYERAKSEYWASLLAAEQGNAPLIVLDAGLCEDSPLLPEGFSFWDELGGKGNIQSSDDAGNDDIVPLEQLSKYQLFSVIENDSNGQCDVIRISNGIGLSKEMLNSSHCFVLDCYSEIFVWAGMESSGNEKSWALLKAEELEHQDRPSCIVVSWILDRDEMLFFREQFIDWRDSNWMSLLKHTKYQKSLEVVDVLDYDKVLTKQMKNEEKRLAKGESYTDMKRKKIANSSSTIKRISRKITTTSFKTPPIVKEKTTSIEPPKQSEHELESYVTTIKETQTSGDTQMTETNDASREDKSQVKMEKPKYGKRRKVKIPTAFASEPAATIITPESPKPKKNSPTIKKQKPEAKAKTPVASPTIPKKQNSPQPITSQPTKSKSPVSPPTTKTSKVKIPSAFSGNLQPETANATATANDSETVEPVETAKSKTPSRLARLKSPLKGPSRTNRATRNPVKDRARKEKEDEGKRVSAEDAQQAARRNAAAGAYGMLWALGVDSSLFEKRQARRANSPAIKTTKPPHLYHIKGRRRVFIREVETSYTALNSGDVFILDNGERILFMWNGKKANRIEKGSALDFAKKLKDKHYFGNAQIVTLEDGKNDSAPNAKSFWELLGTGKIKSHDAGGDDNEAVKLFRDCVKLFRVERIDSESPSVELVLVCDGPYPKELLNTNECFIMDCMTEIYPWTGKKANLKLRQLTVKKAKEMAEERPFWVADVDRQLEGGECVLFKERFNNWSSGLPITVAQVAVGINTAKVQLTGKVDISPLHTKAQKKEEIMIDDATGDIKIWQIADFEKVLINAEQYGFFYSGESYIVLYKYIWKNKDCFIIYYFQGRDSSINEKGTSAVLTIELDKEISGMAKEIRVVQYKEPKHFLQMFHGKMVIHSGKSVQSSSSSPALYDIRQYTNGTRGVQCHCRTTSLNPMHTFVLVSGVKFFVWFGKFSPQSERDFALENKLLLGKESSVIRVEQGKETSEFWKALGGKKKFPYSGITVKLEPRLFHCSVGTGTFGINEVLDYSQDDLSTHDIYIVDALIDVFVWFGRRSAEKEQRWSMEAAVEYVKTSPLKRPKVSVWRVKEGEEPYLFTTHFHSWMCKKHSEQANGIDGGLDDVNALLEQFSRKYTYEELCSGKFSKALDTANIEQYMEDDEFEKIFKMDRDEFSKMPGWKRTNLKKSLGLF